MTFSDKRNEDFKANFSQLDSNIVRLDVYREGKQPEDAFYQLELESSELDDEVWDAKKENGRISIFRNDSILISFSGISFSKPEWFKDPDHDFPDKWTTVNQKIDPGAKIFGFGEKSGYLEKSRSRYEMWNVDPGGFYKHNEDPLYVSIPFYILVSPVDSPGPKYLGIYLVNPDYSQFDAKYLSGPNNLGMTVNSESLTMCLITGDSLDEIVERYTDLTGKPCMLPRWALGYHHSKYGMPMDQEEAVDLVEKFRGRGIPLDSLYLDIQHMQDYKIFTWDENRFPKPSDLMEELHEKNVKPVTIQDPGVKIEEGYEVYDSGEEKDVFVGDEGEGDFIGMLWPGLSKFPDFVREDVREWWGEQNAKILDLGVSGIWNDMNEPAVFLGKDRFLDLISEIYEKDEEGDISLEDFHELGDYPVNATEGMIHRDDEGEEIPHEMVHNLYALLEADGTVRGFESESPEKRPFILTRAGFSGIQRRAAVWTGDNTSTWEHMKMSIQMILNLGLSGLPFSGADVGGFDGDVEPELLTRWNQLGAMMPLFRNHSSIGTVSQEPWSFGDPYERIIKRYIELRYEIMPYLYTLHYESHESGRPIVRPIFMEFPADDESFDIDDEFMVGDSLLVAPVVERGARKRRVYLPRGEDGKTLNWENWWTGNVLESGYHTVSAPLDIMPIFIRENSVVPMMDPVQNTEEDSDTLYLRCNLEDSAESMIYWDDGKTKGFEDGEYFYGKIKVEDDGEEITTSIEPEKTGFEPFWDSIKVRIETLGA